MEHNTKSSPGDKSLNDTKLVPVVTGSSGLIGNRIIGRLAPDYRIVGLDKEGNPYPSKEAECVNFDITDPDSTKLALERIRYGYGDKITSVIHLAAYYGFSGKPSPLYEEVTVKGTEKFIKALQDFHVEQFIFSSTNLIYKPTEPGKKINEDARLAPNWDYPESKVDTEELIKSKRGKIPAVLLRLHVCNPMSVSICCKRLQTGQSSQKNRICNLVRCSGNAGWDSVDVRRHIPVLCTINKKWPETYWKIFLEKKASSICACGSTTGSHTW